MIAISKSNRLWITLLACALLPVPAIAQTEAAGKPQSASKDQPKPRMPVLPQAPNRAEWVVRMTAVDAPGASKAGDHPAVATPAPGDAAPAQGVVPTIRAIQYSKDGELKTYRVQTSWSDGTIADEWMILGDHLAKRPDGKGLYVVQGDEGVMENLAKSDFFELSWLNMSYYRGVKSYQGNPVFVFSVPFDQKPLTKDEARSLGFAKKADPSISPSKYFNPKASDVLIYLSTVTQLPVMYNDGRVIRHYEFTQPTDARLRPPQNYIDFLRARREKMRAYLTPPPGPGTP